jgi:hypothetical protein
MEFFENDTNFKLQEVQRSMILQMIEKTESDSGLSLSTEKYGDLFTWKVLIMDSISKQIVSPLLKVRFNGFLNFRSEIYVHPTSHCFWISKSPVRKLEMWSEYI